MARIRTIKPELPSDRKLAGVSRDARYTFLLLISQADDDGLIRAEPRQLLGALFPYDDDVDSVTLERWLSELVGIEVIRFGATRDRGRIVELVNFNRHQRIKHRSKPFLATQIAAAPDSGTQVAAECTTSGTDVAGQCGGAESGVLSPESGVYLTADAGQPGATVEPYAYSPAFDAAWKAYPKRPNNSKAHAWRAWQARCKAGEDPALMLAGVIAYAAYVAQERTEPRYVKQGATFFGPDRHYLNDFTPASTGPPGRLSAQTAELHDESDIYDSDPPQELTDARSR